MTTVVKEIKKCLINGEKVRTVFSNAFGNVNRNRLLCKLRKKNFVFHVNCFYISKVFSTTDMQGSRFPTVPENWYISWYTDWSTFIHHINILSYFIHMTFLNASNKNLWMIWLQVLLEKILKLWRKVIKCLRWIGEWAKKEEMLITCSKFITINECGFICDCSTPTYCTACYKRRDRRVI